MKKFFNVLLVTVLLAIIVGGVGYIGYSYLFMDHTDRNMASTQESKTDQPDSSTQVQPGMQHGSNDQSEQTESSQQPSAVNSIALKQTTTIFKNKERLSTAIAGLNDSLKYLTLDPYGSSATDKMGTNDSDPAAQPNNTVMQNMGTGYDPGKMEQLHTGLYNLSVGKALLEQLNNDFISQAEYANINVQDPVSYYTNQYNLTQQNKMKLSSALNYINSAAELVNINPYITSQGLVYDKDRMEQIHQSVFKLADSVVALNLLNDDLTKQSINLVGLTQNYINSVNTQIDHSTMTTGLFGGIFDNIGLQSIVNIILILFVAGLIFGIFGFILNLIKGPKKSAVVERAKEELA